MSDDQDFDAEKLAVLSVHCEPVSDFPQDAVLTPQFGTTQPAPLIDLF